MWTLPTGDFKWVDPGKVEWSNLSRDAPHGYFLEVDITIPEHLHDFLDELPPLPENRVPPKPDGSVGKTSKLLATLYDKQRYVLHYTLLQQAVRLGVRVTKVHRVLSFSQKRWMKKYIEFNSIKRTQSTNE